MVAADLNSGRAVIFGRNGWDHVPISLAVQASTALPGLYPPVLIDGRYYVDGVLLKTLHASTILDSGVKLAICVNPIVPVDTRSSVETGHMRRGKLMDRGMVSVLSQTFRTMIHSRLVTGISSYEHRYEDADVLLFEPSKEDYKMFFTNIFSFSTRKAVCEHAYKETIKDLSRRRDEIGPILERHGLRLKTEFLDDPSQRIWKSVSLYKRQTHYRTTRPLDEALNRLEALVKKKSMAQQKASSKTESKITTEREPSQDGTENEASEVVTGSSI